MSLSGLATMSGMDNGVLTIKASAQQPDNAREPFMLGHL
jgi:hypothetical protein